jgi:hypothetical protein
LIQACERILVAELTRQAKRRQRRVPQRIGTRTGREIAISLLTSQREDGLR